LQTVGLETLVWHNTTNESEIRVELIVYNGQLFHSAEELLAAWHNGGLNVAHITPDYVTTSFHPRGAERYGDNKEPPKTIDPAGRRFSVENGHVEWLGWSFDYNTRGFTGVNLFDIRFRGERYDLFIFLFFCIFIHCTLIYFIFILFYFVLHIFIFFVI
jgi:hypothetical protein